VTAESAQTQPGIGPGIGPGTAQSLPSGMPWADRADSARLAHASPQKPAFCDERQEP